jgi:hypothetical protein
MHFPHLKKQSNEFHLLKQKMSTKEIYYLYSTDAAVKCLIVENQTFKQHNALLNTLMVLFIIVVVIIMPP